MTRCWFRLCVCVALLITGLPPAAGAEVIDASPAGFTSKNVVEIAVPADIVYATLLKVETWWDPAHTYSGDAKNLTIDARPGGCFCETWSKGSRIRRRRLSSGPMSRFQKLSSSWSNCSSCVCQVSPSSE